MSTNLTKEPAARTRPGSYVLELRPGGGFRAVYAHHFVIGPGAAARLVADPSAFRFRYEVSS